MEGKIKDGHGDPHLSQMECQTHIYSYLIGASVSSVIHRPCGVFPLRPMRMHSTKLQRLHSIYISLISLNPICIPIYCLLIT